MEKKEKIISVSSKSILSDLVTEITKVIYTNDEYENVYVMYVRTEKFDITKEEYELMEKLIQEKKENVR